MVVPGDPGERAALAEVVRHWRAWYSAELAPAPDPDTDAWVGSRLEYRFSVAAGTAADEVVLRAPEFAGGEADWFAFDLDQDPEATLGVAADAPVEQFTRTLQATPLRFAGMPADRLWEFEDAAVNLGALQVEPHDLARLLLVEFAMTYGNDWLVVPLEVPFGSLTTIKWVTYTNTFGERFRVHHPRGLRPNDPWRMFTITAPDGSGLDALLTPPAVVSFQEGRAGEEILLLRDELANLVWAVERTVEGPSGDPRSRGDEHTESGPRGPGPVPTAELDYLLEHGVPEHWIPYLATTNGYRSIELVKGAMRRFQSHVDEPPLPPEGVPVEPVGRLLNEPGSRHLVDGEVPREGVRVSRLPVLARGLDGGYHRWTARRIGVGRGEGLERARLRQRRTPAARRGLRRRAGRGPDHAVPAKGVEMNAYPHLFSPLQIGNVTVRNRIMQTAHVKLFAYNAVDSDRNVAYQAARAKGGAGLLITGNRVVHPTSTTGFPRVAWAYLPEALEADRRLTDGRARARRGDLRPAQPLRR